MKYAKEEKFINFGFKEPKISSLPSFTEELNNFFVKPNASFKPLLLACFSLVCKWG